MNMNHTEFVVIGTTETGECSLRGFGFQSREAAEALADQLKIEQPVNSFTKSAYTYTVHEGQGSPRFEGTPLQARIRSEIAGAGL